MALTEEQKDIIHLLLGEIDEQKLLCKTFKQTVAGTSLNASHLETFQQETQFSLTNFLQAIQLVGFNSLEKICQHILANLDNLSQKTAHPQYFAFIAEWPSIFGEYLSNYPSAPSSTLQKKIFAFLTLNQWPVPIAKNTLKDILSHDQNASFKLENQQDDGPDIESDSAISLEIPTDIRPELVVSLKQELPPCVQDFDNAITLFLESNSKEHLLHAQRVAHTLKGSGNIVGINGLANLMHLTEDFLDHAGKRSTVSTQEKLLLQDATDCLSNISDYLCHAGEKPENYRILLQSLKNYKNNSVEQENQSKTEKTHQNDIGAHNKTLKSNKSTITNTVKKNSDAYNSQHQRETENDYFFSLPNQDASHLLRLSGETDIGISQFITKISEIKSILRASERFHTQIRDMAHHLESLVQSQNAIRTASLNFGKYEMDPLEMERFSELHTFSNQLMELTTDSSEAISQVKHELDDLNSRSYFQQQLNKENQEILLNIRLIAVKDYASRFQRCVRQASRQTGKKVSLSITGTEQLIDNRVLNIISDPIMHLLRNAVDHGIEHTDERIKQGKTEEGIITLDFSQQGEMITIQCTDDGRGLNYEKVRQQAIERQLIDDNTEISPSLLHQIILLPGFTTKREATQTSGRGIGLDAVTADITRLKGSLSLESQTGCGTQFIIKVPSSILTTHALICHVNIANQYTPSKVALTSRNIEEIVFLEAKHFSKKKGLSLYTLNGRSIPVLPLHEILSVSAPNESTPRQLIITRKSDNEPVAIAVESIQTNREIVIKALNKYTPHTPGIIGATVLGDGAIAPVIDIQELPTLRFNNMEDYQKHVNQYKPSLQHRVEPERATVLIVDDSLSARRTLAQFISDMGMDAVTAQDGFDAIHCIDEQRPNLVLVDLEMPRMNGLELTAHIRSRTDMLGVPVIMITSRSTDKHRKLAKSAGVSDYLNKPWSEDDLMQSIETQFQKRASAF